MPMRRRDFLLGAAGLAGSLGSGIARAGNLPCPPGALRINDGSVAISECGSESALGGPAWFHGLKPMRWTPLAGGPQMAEPWQRGERLAEAVPPPPYFGNYGPRYLTAGWNGACVDSKGLEMIVALNGGHAARQENDAYALALGTETPHWRRVVESTPARDPESGVEYLTRSPLKDGNGAAYKTPLFLPGWTLDGPQPRIAFDDREPDLGIVHRRPRTLHTCSHYHYSNGKIWYPIMNSWDRGTGETSLVKLALDIDALRREPELGAWRYGDLGPWSYLGTISEQREGATDSFGFGVASLDPTSGRIWYVGQRSTAYWSLETLGPSAGSHTYYRDAPVNKDLSSSAGAIAHDIRVSRGGVTSLFVIMEQGSYRVWILDTALAGRGNGWSVVEPDNARLLQWSRSLQTMAPGYVGYPSAYGMVYDASSMGFLAYNCDQMPDRGAVRVLRIPIRSDGTYEPGGRWRWENVHLDGEGPDENNPGAGGTGGGGGSYTRFSRIDDFAGSGDALLMHLSRYDKPTWVCRIPKGAFA